MLATDPRSKNAAPQFNNSLARTVVITLLLLSILPAILITAFTFLRARSLLQQQASQQLETIVNTYGEQLEEMARARQELLQQTFTDAANHPDIDGLINSGDNEINLRLSRMRLNDLLTRLAKSPGESNFDALMILSPEGKILLASNANWVGADINPILPLKDVTGKDTSTMVYDMAPFYPGQLVVLSTFFYQSPGDGPSATVVGIVTNPLPETLLSSAGSFFKLGEAYFYTSGSDLVGLDQNQTAVIPFQTSVAEIEQLAGLRRAGTRQSIAIQSKERPVLAYAHWMPVLHAAMVVAVPQQIAYERIQSLLPASGLTLLVALIVTGVFIYMGTTRVVRPLIQLAQKANQFSKGDWTQRAEVNRSDEIGLLAHSFNTMVEDLTTLYRSLEGKVEERTRQLRTASEVAQVATSVSERQEMLTRTMDLLTERFGYHYASIYLVDESGQFAVLQAVSSITEEAARFKGMRIPVSQQNAVGQVALTLEPFISGNAIEDSAVRGRTLLARTRSQVILPIAIGPQVYGVLDVQSAQVHAFDHESVAVLQTLTSQIASGLRNILMLSSTQVNLEETALLSRASRQVTQAQTGEEVLQVLSESLAQTGYVTLLLAVGADNLDLISWHDSRSFSSDATVKGTRFSRPEDVHLFEEQRLLIANDLHAPLGFEDLSALLVKRECKSLALLPILLKGSPAYIVAVSSRRPEPLTATNLQPYINLCEVAGSALERFDVMVTLQKRLFELETLKAIGDTISVEIQLDRLMEVLHQQVIERIGSDISFGVALYYPETNLVEIPYISDGSERIRLEPFPIGEGLSSIVILQRKALLLTHDTEQAARQLGARVVGKAARSWMGVPLIAAGECLGALIVQDMVNDARFSEDDLNLFTTLAPQVANTIRNARLLSEMQQAIRAYDQERFLLNTLLANIPERVYFKDGDGEYIRVSQSFSNQVGIENPAEVMGKSDVDLFGPESGLVFYEKDQDILHSGEAEIAAVEKESLPDGSAAWMLTSKIPLTDAGGEKVGLLGLSQDITSLKAAEQLTERRASQLQTAAEVARDTTSSLEANEILRRAVELIRSRFGFYHASIFLVDPLGEYASLRESSGEIGARMKQTGHRLAVGSQSLVGRATGSGEPVVVNNVRLEPNYYANPLLPDTMAEAVLPFKAGDRVLGALDVQSIHVGAFSEDDIHTLQILADQVAVAVVNANLFTKMQEHLAKHRLLHQLTSEATAAGDMDAAMQVTVAGLRTALSGERAAIYYRGEDGEFKIRAASGYSEQALRQMEGAERQDLLQHVILNKQSVRITDTHTDSRFEYDPEFERSLIAVPVLFVDEVVGVLRVDSSRPAAFDENDQEILGTLGSSLGAIIANAHLIARVRLQTERQKQLFEITSKIRRSVDVETILKTSATELAKALQARQARIEITPGAQPESVSMPTGGNGSNGKNGSHSSHAGQEAVR